MNSTCIFCRIVAGSASARQVFEDDDVLAFMDHRPLNPGHVLVIPKGHEPDFHRLDEPTYLAVMQASKRLAAVLGDFQKSFYRLACLRAQARRCRLSYIALLCAFGSV